MAVLRTVNQGTKSIFFLGNYFVTFCDELCSFCTTFVERDFPGSSGFFLILPMLD